MALTYALYELARHPHIQQRLVEEVDRFGREQEPQYGNLAQFPLVDAVLKEGMRLHPPVTPLIALVYFHPPVTPPCELSLVNFSPPECLGGVFDDPLSPPDSLDALSTPYHPL